MDHIGISNTVGSTGEFSVAGVATPDVSSCWGFWVWYVKRPLRKLATKIFDLSLLILGVCLNVYFSLQWVRIVFFCLRGKVCSLLYNLLYQFSQFPVSMEHLKLRKQKWPSRYRRATTGLHEWTGRPCREPGILLQIASTVQSFMLLKC